MKITDSFLFKLTTIAFLALTLAACQPKVATVARPVAKATSTAIPTRNATEPALAPQVRTPTTQQNSTRAANPTVVASNTPAAVRTVAQSTPVIPVGSFSSSSFQKAPPADILQQLADGAWGGGGGTLTLCENYKTGITSHFDIRNPKNEKVMEQYHRQIFTSCGWKKNEQVQAVLTYPSGKISSTKISADDLYGGFEFDFTPLPGDPLGGYSISFQGSSGKSGFSFQVNKTSTPGLIDVEAGKLLVFGFQPNEKVRLVSYQAGQNGLLKFEGIQEFQVDGSGLLFITHNIKLLHDPLENPYNVYAIGERSGTYPKHKFVGTVQLACPGAPASRLVIGRFMKTIAVVDARIFPGISQNKTAQLKLGAQGMLLQGPECANQAFWWKIDQGWVPESVNGQYVLQPAY